MKLTGSLLFIFLLCSASAFSQVVSLKGGWKFHIDDEASWSSANFDDTAWESIQAPSPWEDQGFYGYDGFAWYRKKFDGRALDRKENYYLGLGFIDDADEVYVNGKLIGFSGSMPPGFKTAYNSERKYNLPAEVINYRGENTIAIRVFDSVLGGGIIDGKLGIFRSKEDHALLLDLQGVWSFALSASGDPIRKESEWRRIMVPGPWEYKGYYKYDGFAWYRRNFTLPQNFATGELVLVMGKIDDFDKVYLNGQLIGTTNDQQSFGRSQSYSKNRVYAIPPQSLKRNGVNTVEVLVEDMGDMGGIYQGPIGIAAKSTYEKR